MFRHEFSWSYSRYRLFRRCKLAYFFHYYGSWGGWDQYSDDRTRHIYLLKNLKKSDSWIEYIFRNSLIETLQDGEYDFRKMKRKAFSKLNSDFCDLRNLSWKEDPKKINLFEYYYNSKSFSKIESESKKKLSTLLANFAEIRPMISSIPYLSLKNFKRPVSFLVDGIKVWSAPDIIFEEQVKIIVLDLFFKDPAKYSGWAFKTAVDAIFAESNWPERIIELKSVFLHEKDYPQLAISRNIKEVRSIINSSSHEMLALTKLDTRIKEEEFIPTEKKDSCELCVYKKICG